MFFYKEKKMSLLDEYDCDNVSCSTDDEESSCDNIFASSIMTDDCEPACPPEEEEKEKTPCPGACPGKKSKGVVETVVEGAGKAAEDVVEAVAGVGTAAEIGTELSKKTTKKAPVKTKKLTPQESDEEYRRKRVTNTYVITKDFTMRELQGDQEKATWRVSPSASWMFKKKGKNVQSGAGGAQADRKGDPTKAVVESVTVKRIFNTAPVEIGVRIPFINTNMFDANGNNFSFIMGDGEAMRGSLDVYNNNDVMNEKGMRHYGHLSEDSISKTFTKDINPEYVQVQASSPIIKVMRFNSGLIEVLNKSQYLDMDGGRFCIKANVVDAVFDRLRGMLADLPHRDMTKFSVEFSRADGEKWDSPANIRTMGGNSAKEIQEALDQKNRIALELEVTHILTTLDD